MTVAIDFSTHRARLLKAGPGGLGPSLDNPHAGRPAPSMEERPGFSFVVAFRVDGFLPASQATPLTGGGSAGSSGSRALDILIALIERHGELVTRRELMSRAWPGIAVVDANLSVQMAKLRGACMTVSAASATWSRLPGRVIVCRANLDGRGAAVRACVAAADGRCRSGPCSCD